MPTLRQRLKLPQTYLFVVGLVLLAAVADGFRPARSQVSARIYVHMVGIYQQSVSPALRPYIRCRYVPTCSEYSRQAVAEHGIFHGLALSVQRILSCRPSVPMGTLDPVPRPHPAPERGVQM